MHIKLLVCWELDHGTLMWRQHLYGRPLYQHHRLAFGKGGKRHLRKSNLGTDKPGTAIEASFQIQHESHCVAQAGCGVPFMWAIIL